MADVDNKIKMIVEGLLLAAGKPLSLNVIAGVFSEDERPDNVELREVLSAIAEDCGDRGFELREVASGFRFQVKQEISEWIARLWEEKPPRYSRALLETLALIAYRQPITRGDIEEIRGVGVSSNIMRTLIDREWVRVVGHKDVPGKPALYATTKQFLDYFNLKSIQELPPLSEIRELAQASGEFDVEDDLASRNVLELPEEEPEGPAEMVDEEGEVRVFDADELPDEDEAAELSKKPLDEILGLGDQEGDEEVAAEDDSVPTEEAAEGDEGSAEQDAESDGRLAEEATGAESVIAEEAGESGGGPEEEESAVTGEKVIDSDGEQPGQEASGVDEAASDEEAERMAATEIPTQQGEETQGAEEISVEDAEDSDRGQDDAEDVKQGTLSGS